MKIKIKKLHPNAKMPTQGTEDAAGFDLYISETVRLDGRQYRGVKIPTGLAFEIPKGYCGVVYSRSGSATEKFGTALGITPLIVDADYRGEVFVVVRPEIGNDNYIELKAGERIAQMRIEKLVPTEYEWADELTDTKRGAGACGSTGR